MSLVNWLVENRHISPESANVGAIAARCFGGTTLEQLHRFAVVDDGLYRDVASALAVAVASSEDLMRPDLGALEQIGAETAAELRAVPIHRDEGTVIYALADPLDVGTLEELEFFNNGPIERRLATPLAIAHSLRLAGALVPPAPSLDENTSGYLAVASLLQHFRRAASIVVHEGVMWSGQGTGGSPPVRLALSASPLAQRLCESRCVVRCPPLRDAESRFFEQALGGGTSDLLAMSLSLTGGFTLLACAAEQRDPIRVEYLKCIASFAASAATRPATALAA